MQDDIFLSRVLPTGKWGIEKWGTEKYDRRDQAKSSCAGLKSTYFVPEAGST
jgi:hypothetical protein